MNFDEAVAMVLKHEGGYVNHPSDPGGETKWGISRRAYPWLDIPNLTQDDAKAIYRRDYWNRIKGDQLPPQVAAMVFDSAVNQGVSRAIRFMQKSLRVNIDGIIGPKTMAAAQAADLAEFAVRFAGERAEHYARLPTFTIFGRGWMRRLLETTITVMLHGH